MPELPALIYSVYEDSDQLFKATPGGATGYLLKRTPPEQMLEPIAGLLSQGPLKPQLIVQQVKQYFQNVTTLLQSGESIHEMGKLTPREKEILGYLSKGYLDKEIAQSLGISVWTVHGHLKNIFEKLQVHSRTEAVVKYLQK
jgi:DNA-binding NarL/FixJ family response regulator